MLIDWIHWFTSLNPEIKIAAIACLLLIDFPRYLVSFVLTGLWDFGRQAARWLLGRSTPRAYGYCPSVCVILPAHNEADTLEATLTSILGTYPRLEIIVIDDGSTDGSSEVVRRFLGTHPELRLLRRAERGGKASALNWALHSTRAEVVVCVDADSHLGPHALWEIVQPLADPAVGAVAGTILARNPFASLAARLQAQEYLRSNLLGRRLSSRMGILSIISGAFGAFRRLAVQQLGGWNVGPGEDSDLTLAIRKSGLEVAFVGEAQCFTNLPTDWFALMRQRLRWDRSFIRGNCRQHVDLLFPWMRSFRITNFYASLESFFFSVICLYGFWASLALHLFRAVFCGEGPAWEALLTCALCYLMFYPIQLLVILFYSNNPMRDVRICLPLWPVVPFYWLFLSAIRLVAVTGEIFLRKSFDDNFYPLRCRQATWRW